MLQRPLLLLLLPLATKQPLLLVELLLVLLLLLLLRALLQLLVVCEILQTLLLLLLRSGQLPERACDQLKAGERQRSCWRRAQQVGGTAAVEAAQAVFPENDPAGVAEARQGTAACSRGQQGARQPQGACNSESATLLCIALHVSVCNRHPHPQLLPGQPLHTARCLVNPQTLPPSKHPPFPTPPAASTPVTCM